MQFISNFLARERAHFKSLPAPARKLAFSYTLYNFAYAFLGVFINAFLFRNSNSFFIVALYNVGTFVGLPVGFFINGLLLKKISINKLYLISCIGQGISVLFLIFIQTTMPIFIFLFGFLFGVSAGFFWVNRHSLSLISTQDENRNYFEGTVTSIATIIRILIPPIIGWTIVAGTYTNLYDPQSGYKILILIATVILYFAGIQIKKDLFNQPPPQLFLKKISKRWRLVRLMGFFNGIKSGIFFYAPSLIILTLVGKEGALGSLSSFSALIAAIIVYLGGRLSGVKHRFLVTIAGFVILNIGSVIININFTLIGAVMFIILDSIAENLEFLTYLPIMYQSIDRDNEKDDGYNYARICDLEVFFNLGRLIGTAFFIYVAFASSEVFSLKVSLLFAAVFQIISIMFLYRLINHRSEFVPEFSQKNPL